MNRRWRLILVGLAAVCMTVLGIIIAFVNHVEEPPHDAELLAIGTVALCNLLWLVPWTVVHRKKRDKRMVLAGGIIFALCWIHFPYRYVHHPAFDSITWKASPDYSRMYVSSPAHSVGYMVPDIIASGVCVGKTRVEVEAMWGPHTIPQSELEYCSNDSCIGYFYSGKVLFDGCDKLMLCFKNDICTHAGYCGCD